MYQPPFMVALPRVTKVSFALVLKGTQSLLWLEKVVCLFYLLNNHRLWPRKLWNGERSAIMQNSFNVSEKSDKTLTEIQIFENSEFGKVRSLLIDNEPYFVGKDVAEILGYENPSVAISKKVDAEDKGFSKMETPGGIQDVTVINESGLYSLILSSKLPGAKKFKHWVTSEVLPSIRKNGGYYIPKTYSEALMLCANQVKKIEEMQPKAVVYDDLVERSKTINFRDMASKLGMSQNEFMTILKAKYIYKNSVGEYRAYSEYQDLFTLRTFAKGVDKTGEQLMLSMKGITYFCNKYKPGAVAESFIEKGEKEYQKIIGETAEKVIEKKYTIKQVAELAGETVEVIRNFSILEHYLDEEGKPTIFSTDIIGVTTPDGHFTEKGKNNIISTFALIHNGEKGMRRNSTGKAE